MLSVRTRQSMLPWAAWFIASVTGMFQFMLQSSSSVMIHHLQDDFAINLFQVGILSSSFFYTYLIFQVPAGMIIDILRARRTLIICQGCISILCVMFAMSKSVWMAGASRILMGMFAAPTIIAAFYIAARRLPEKYFVLAAGLTETMVMLGGMLGEALVARGVTAFGWRHTMMILAVVAIGITVLAYLIINDNARSQFAEPEIPHSDSILKDFWAMVCVPQSWINGLYAAFQFALIAAFGAFWCVPFLMKLYGISLNKAADASSLIFIGAAIGAPLLSYVASRFENRPHIMKVYALGGLFSSIAVIYVPMSYAMMCLAIFTLGFFASAYLLSYDMMRTITLPSMRGTAMGYTNMMCILIGAPILQPFIGWFLERNGTITAATYQRAFLVIPIGMVIALVLSFMVREKPLAETEPRV